MIKIVQNISQKVKVLELFLNKSLLPHIVLHSGLSFVLATSQQGSLKTLCPGAASDNPSVHRTAPHSAP